MKNNDKWVIVDTETSGLMPPICAVEISAQRMSGWEPAGGPFHMLLNHDVPIEPAAQSLHGYSREFLRQHGQNPVAAHKTFHEYVYNLPLVAYNISFDWNRVLEPEYKRLNVPITGTKGFCAMTLARRCITETEDYRLETLKNHFKLGEEQSHRGLNDVQFVVRLFKEVFKGRLIVAGIEGFSTVAAFSRKTPVSKCQEMIINKASISAKSESPRTLKKIGDEYKDYINELRGFCNGITADEELTDLEVNQLHKLIASCPFSRDYPMNIISEALERIYEDGDVTTREREELLKLLTNLQWNH